MVERIEATGTHLVAVLGALGNGCMAIDEVAAHLPMARRKVSTAAGRLISRGLVERLEIGCYRLTVAGREVLEAGTPLRSGPRRKHTGASAPRVDTLRQRAWNAMRLCQRFTVGDILTIAARPDDGLNPAGNLTSWFGRLARAGYLVELPNRATTGTALTSNGFKIWRLVRDTGDIAPVYRAPASIYDHNTREVTPCR